MAKLGWRVVVLALVSVGLGAGCGPSERAPDAAAVAERFQAALAQGDGEAACAELREQTRSKLEQQEKKPCEQSILTLELPKGGTAGVTRVYLTNASVALREGGTTFLDEGADGWKVTDAGCEPTAPQLPFECELEG